jgi:kynurenine formamidase
MIIDLSHTIKMGMPFYPGSSQPKISDLGLYDEQGVYVLDANKNRPIAA